MPMPMSDTSDEANRVARLRELMVLDSAPEPVFDSIVTLASEVCGVPIALVSLVDSERQWFKANVGLRGVNENPREIAFCAHAIADDAVFEVPDAMQDARFANNPLVTGKPHIRFYAGAPLILPGGERVGTLCVIDRQARRLDASQMSILRSLAKIATEALLARRELIERAASVRHSYEQALADSESRYRAIVEEQAELVSLAQADGTLVFVNAAYASHFGQLPEQMHGRNLFEFIDVQDRSLVRKQIDHVLCNGQSQSNENRMVAANGSIRWVAWTNGVQRGGQGRALLHSVGRDITDRRLAEQALRASQAALVRTGRIAGVGGWQLELATDALVWSDETRRIHDVGPDFKPTLATAVAFYAPEVRATIENAVRRAMLDGTPWDLELPLVTASGRQIWVRAQGEVEFDDGAPVRLAGAFQDISERRHMQQRMADNERFVRQVTDALPLRVAYLDKQLRYQFVNRADCERFGRPREDILGRTQVELTGRGNDALVLARLQVALGGEAQHFEMVEGTGEAARSFASQLIPDVADDASVRGLYSIGIDITQRSASERALRERTATLRSVTEAIPASVAVVGRDQCYRFVNTAFERWAGARRDQIIGRNLSQVMSATDFERSLPWIERALAGESVQFERGYQRLGSASHIAVSYIPLWKDDGTVDGFVGVLQDISQHKREEVRLLQLAQRDALTGLLNRAGFEQQMAYAVKSGEGNAMALLYIDLDHFKPVNDQFGHPAGDQVLQQFAQRVTTLVRPSDAVARLGGDEFAILLIGMRDDAKAHAVAQKVIGAATEPFEVDGKLLCIGASVGVAMGLDASAGWPDLVARADARLYEAKNAGRGRIAGVSA